MSHFLQAWFTDTIEGRRITLRSDRDKWGYGPGLGEGGRGVKIEKLLEKNKENGSQEMDMAQLVKVPATHLMSHA